jgi:hypothetical protein
MRKFEERARGCRSAEGARVCALMLVLVLDPWVGLLLRTRARHVQVF